MEAWSKVYLELHPEETASPDPSVFCGPRNDIVLQRMAPWLTQEERDRVSEHKEELYRKICQENHSDLTLVAGVETFLDSLQRQNIPFALATASIKANVDFYFERFGLNRWFRKEDIVYDDGSYANKGQMHLEAARRLNRDISQCLLVEDSASSIGFARENGAGCVVAISQHAAAEDLLKLGADRFIRDFTEFDLSWLQDVS